MAFQDVDNITGFAGFSVSEVDQIRDSIRKLYEVSPTAREMFDQWLSDPDPIFIVKVPNAFQTVGPGQI